MIIFTFLLPCRFATATCVGNQKQKVLKENVFQQKITIQKKEKKISPKQMTKHIKNVQWLAAGSSIGA